MSINNSLLILFVSLILGSCSTVKLSNFKETKKFESNRTANNNRYSNNLISEDFVPKYKYSGGETKVRFYNFKRAKAEEEIYEAMIKLDSVRMVIPEFKSNSIETDYVDLEIQNIIAKLQSEIVRLENLLIDLELTDVNSHEEITRILTEINRLKCEKVDGLKLLRKKINVLRSDLMFEIGKFKITNSGSKIINGWVENTLEDISKWKDYINQCNQKIFEDDTFILTVNIAGYADPQGKESVNLKLSKNRADAVKSEITRQLLKLLKTSKVKIVFENIHAIGLGEQLPQGMVYNGENDSKRRVCIVNSLIAPSKVIN